MEAYNRVATSECSTNYGLNTVVLRNEWGFKGACLTDGYSTMIGCEKYENPDIQIRAGAVLSVVFLIIRPRKKSKIVIEEVK